MVNLPPNLYRGDADEHGVRELRNWRFGVLQTNLSNGGSGREIFTSALVDVVRRHVDVGWEKTHFLSFSESCQRALEFAGGIEGRILLPATTNAWDTALITIDTKCFTTAQEQEAGIYKCTYLPDPCSHRNHTLSDMLSPRQLFYALRQERPISVLLINVITFLQKQISVDQNNLEDALEKAVHDKEWLLLPLEPADGIPGELTAALDISCISSFDCYIFAKT